jgi:predicted short-subunit dehydrogenase-like oxidoreductase (DUF2520 family)
MTSKVRERAYAGSKKRAAARSRRSQRRPTISIVGAGRLGTALGLALSGCGYQVEAVVARSLSHARRAAQLIGTHPLALSTAELYKLPPSDLLFITTPDDMIYETARRIADRISERAQGRMALHTSGALSSEELQSLRDAGFSTGSMHPLVAVSDARAGAESLRRAFFCIEGERSAASAATRIVRDLGAHSFSITTEGKALYHAAAVTASGHMVALFDIASEMLSRCGLKERDARSILLPLVESTLDNLKDEPARALTGTFARADVETVRRHLKAIGLEGMSDARAAYTLLGKRSLGLAKKRGADAESLKAILKLLNDAVE